MDLRETTLEALTEAVQANPALASTLLRHTQTDNNTSNDPQSSASTAAVGAEEDTISMLWQSCALGLPAYTAFLCGCPGADANFRRAKGQVSALYIAAQNGHVECCEVLLRHGADPNLSRNTGATPLFIATQKNNLIVAELLLRHGAHVDAVNNQRCTPFVLASSMGHTAMALLMLQYGADPLRSETGYAGHHWAKLEGHRDTFHALLQHIFVPKLLIRTIFIRWRGLLALKRKRQQLALMRTEYECRQMIEKSAAVALDDLRGRFQKDQSRVEYLSGMRPLESTADKLGAIDFGVRPALTVALEPLPVPPASVEQLPVMSVHCPDTAITAPVDVINMSLGELCGVNEQPAESTPARTRPSPATKSRTIQASPSTPPESLRYWRLHRGAAHRDLPSPDRPQWMKSNLSSIQPRCKDYHGCLTNADGRQGSAEDLPPSGLPSRHYQHRCVTVDAMISGISPEHRFAAAQEELLRHQTHRGGPAPPPPPRVGSTPSMSASPSREHQKHSLQWRQSLLEVWEPPQLPTTNLSINYTGGHTPLRSPPPSKHHQHHTEAPSSPGGFTPRRQRALFNASSPNSSEARVPSPVIVTRVSSPAKATVSHHRTPSHHRDPSHTSHVKPSSNHGGVDMAAAWKTHAKNVSVLNQQYRPSWV